MSETKSIFNVVIMMDFQQGFIVHRTTFVRR